MYVLAIDFTVHRQCVDAFLPLMLENARLSRQTEPGCGQFDVCRDPARPESVFLYEVYDNHAAFEAHLQTAHFKSFNEATHAMIAAKKVCAYERLND